MEIIRKTICVDEGRSHRNGLLPYVPFNSTDGSIALVDASDDDGNYGGYVCDFVIYSAYTSANTIGMEEDRSKEISRLRYLDVIRKYNYIQEQLRNGVFVKRAQISAVTIDSIQCDILEDTVVSSITSEYKWIIDCGIVSNCGEIEKANHNKYEYTPLPIEYFNENNGIYSFALPEEYGIYVSIDEANRTDEQQMLIDNINDVLSAISASTIAVLIPNYNTVIQYDKDWDEWWSGVTIHDVETNEEKWLPLDADSMKEKAGFFSTEESPFKFCKEFDKYALGRVEVPEKYSGSKVPDYVFYSELYDRILWFEKFSATTINAYETSGDTSQYIIEQWENRGGGDFYNFLTGINAYYITFLGNSMDADENSLFFMYSCPRIIFNELFVNNIETEWMYKPYEYSVIGYEKYGVTKDYVVPEEGRGSALTPTFKEYSEDEMAEVDSKIDTLVPDNVVYITNDIYGVFEEFDKEGNGQFYEVTYCMGSVETEVTYQSGISIAYYTRYNTNGAEAITSSSTKIYTFSSATRTTKAPSTSQFDQVFSISAIDKNVAIELGNEVEEKDVDGRVIKRLLSWTEKTTETYEWWGAIEYTGTDLKCGDGEIISIGEKKYRNATIVSCTPVLVGNYSPGQIFYIKAKYKNGRFGVDNIFDSGGTIVPLGIPYVLNYPVNITSYSDGTIAYDMVTNRVENNDGTITLNYALGITSGSNISTSGIHYKETVPFEGNQITYAPIDGVYNAELYYENVDFNSVLEYVYSDDYKLERQTHRAMITGMEVGTIWSATTAMDSLLVTKENMEGLQDIPNYDINLVYDRGSAAAWEHHYKLAECNTMEDLEKYGNNFFNI